MGVKTKLTKASSRYDSLRTTVPKAFVDTLGLSEGDELDWTIEARDGALILVVQPFIRAGET